MLECEGVLEASASELLGSQALHDNSITSLDTSAQRSAA